MQELDRLNIIIQLKVQTHQNTIQTILSTVLHGLLFQMLQKNPKARKNLEASYITQW